MMKWILGFLDRLFALMGAFLFSQLPLFMQQYAQQLAGHVDELRLQVSALEKLASQSGKTLDQYIHKFCISSDTDCTLQGQFMQGLVQRFQELSASLMSLQQANTWQHPFVFMKDFQLKIGLATYAGFTPGFAMTFESVIYLLGGLFVGYLFYQLMLKGGEFLLKGFRRLNPLKKALFYK